MNGTWKPRMQLEKKEASNQPTTVVHGHLPASTFLRDIWRGMDRVTRHWLYTAL